MPSSAKASGPAIAAIGAGAVFVWAGIKGFSVLQAIKNTIQGQAPGTGQTALLLTNDSSSGGGSASGAGASGGAGNTSANRSLGQKKAAAYGWTGGQWTALDDLWQGESGWSATADTRSSGLDPKGASVFAYGIPQARPYSKMPRDAWPPDKGGKADAGLQIDWGLKYIKSTYGSPQAAKNFKAASGGRGY